MGERLRYEIDIPEDMKEISFPPMLIQPLVENAVKHGLESSIEGGEILVTGSVSRGNIRMEVRDTGSGFHENSKPGIGIENIKNRLKSLFGDRARLILEENRPSGLRAIIEVPYEKDQRDNS
jgi:LytS/YehU family sensor histidine kinase